MISRNAVACLFFGMFSAASFAEQVESEYPVALKNQERSEKLGDYPKVLKQAENDGYLTILGKRTVAEANNIEAIMTQAGDGDYRLYWYDRHNDLVSTGDIVLNSGVALSSKYSAMLTPAPNDVFDQLFDEGLMLGNKPANKNSNSTLYVFYEPFCGFCKKLHKNLKEYIDQGLDMQMIPVAWISDRSPDVIATIRDSDDVSKALFESDNNTLEITSTADNALRQKLNFNRTIMSSLGISGTPGVVYKDKQGQLKITGGLSGEALDKLLKPIMSRG